MKELTNSIMNQANYLNDRAKDKIVDFNKELIRQNPINSMQTQWHIAQMRKNFVFFCTLPFIFGEAYWNAFMQVYTPEGKE